MEKKYTISLDLSIFNYCKKLHSCKTKMKKLLLLYSTRCKINYSYFYNYFLIRHNRNHLKIEHNVFSALEKICGM